MRRVEPAVISAGSNADHDERENRKRYSALRRCANGQRGLGAAAQIHGLLDDCVLVEARLLFGMRRSG